MYGSIVELSARTNFLSASSITKQVLKMKEYQTAKAISIFLSMPGKEVSTHDIAIDALQEWKVRLRALHSWWTGAEIESHRHAADSR